MQVPIQKTSFVHYRSKILFPPDNIQKIYIILNAEAGLARAEESNGFHLVGSKIAQREDRIVLLLIHQPSLRWPGECNSADHLSIECKFDIKNALPGVCCRAVETGLYGKLKISNG